MFDNGGRWVKPTLIDRIQDRYGHTIFKHDARECRGCDAPGGWKNQPEPQLVDRREQVLDSMTAYQITSMMEGVVQAGTATAVKEVGKPIAGKTGTTNDEKDAWFIGYTPDLICGVWVGYDERQSLGGHQTGGSTAAPIWEEFMKTATQGSQVKDFTEPEDIESKKICMETGLVAGPRCPRIRVELFKKGTAPTKVCTLHGAVSTDASQVGAASTGTGGDLLEMEAAPPVAVSTVTNGVTVITTVEPTPVPQTNAEQNYQDAGF